MKWVFVSFGLFSAAMFAWGFWEGKTYAQVKYGGCEEYSRCFSSCASLVLLTPDDPQIYEETVQEVEQCANKL